MRGKPEELSLLFAELCEQARLRVLAPRARRGNPVPLLARLLADCEVVEVEKRAAGFVFRLAPVNSDAAPPVLVTCLLHREASRQERLTTAEAAVAQQLCAGRTLAQIARLRGVSANTIKSQVRQIFRKLNVDSRVALVRHLCL